MATRLVLIATVVVAIVVFANISSNEMMNGAVQNIHASVVTVAYSGEFAQIQKIAQDFVYLREIRSTEEAKDYSERLDEKINNLELVKIYCDERIYTLELAFEQNPYEKIQQICPTLKTISFSKAYELFSLI